MAMTYVMLPTTWTGRGKVPQNLTGNHCKDKHSLAVTTDVIMSVGDCICIQIVLRTIVGAIISSTLLLKRVWCHQTKNMMLSSCCL